MDHEPRTDLQNHDIRPKLCALKQSSPLEDNIVGIAKNKGLQKPVWFHL